MSHEAIAEFADTMLTRFPPFKQWEDYQEKAWADDLVAELSGFSAEVIKRAQREIIRHRKPRDPRPPMVSECIAACVEARRWLEAQENQGKLPAFRDPEGDEWSTERWRVAHELKQSVLGRQAAREGWIHSFVHFCRKYRRHPAGNEIEQCKRDSAGIEEIHAKAMRGEKGPKDAPVRADVALSKAIAKWALDILDKRKKWSEEAL